MRKALGYEDDEVLREMVFKRTKEIHTYEDQAIDLILLTMELFECEIQDSGRRRQLFLSL